MNRHNEAVNAGGKKRYVTYNYEEKFEGLQSKAMLTIIEKQMKVQGVKKKQR